MEIMTYCRFPSVRTLVIWTANYPERLGPLVEYVQNSTKPNCLEITGYRIKYSTIFWLLITS
jgi:hypothetical protein